VAGTGWLAAAAGRYRFRSCPVRTVDGGTGAAARGPGDDTTLAGDTALDTEGSWEVAVVVAACTAGVVEGSTRLK